MDINNKFKQDIKAGPAGIVWLPAPAHVAAYNDHCVMFLPERVIVHGTMIHGEGEMYNATGCTDVPACPIHGQDVMSNFDE